MKKFLAVFSMLIMMSTLSFAQQPANNNGLIGIANGALRSNCDDATGDLQASVSIVSACFIEGFITKVTFYRVPKCPPNTFCIQVIETVGSVTLDCGNNVIAVQCGPVRI